MHLTRLTDRHRSAPSCTHLKSQHSYGRSSSSVEVGITSCGLTLVSRVFEMVRARSRSADRAEELDKRAPISVKFEIPYFTVSGIQVRYLKVVEKSGYQAVSFFCVPSDGCLTFPAVALGKVSLIQLRRGSHR